MLGVDDRRQHGAAFVLALIARKVFVVDLLEWPPAEDRGAMSTSSRSSRRCHSTDRGEGAHVPWYPMLCASASEGFRSAVAQTSCNPSAEASEHRAVLIAVNAGCQVAVEFGDALASQARSIQRISAG